MTEKEKEKQIKAELSRLQKLFSKAAENKKALLAPLIQNAAFMKVTLESLQCVINSNGATDEYRNGANQNGYKQSAEMQSYNALVKNYAAVMKTLSQNLPKENEDGGCRLDKFLESLNNDE